MTYASATAINRRSYRRNQNTVSYASSRSSLGPVSNFVVLLVMACLLAVIYVSQVTKTNSYSYTLNELTSQKQQLQEDFANLEVDTARLQSLDRIKQSQVASQLTDTADVTYTN